MKKKMLRPLPYRSRLDTMIEMSYRDSNALIAKDLDDNVFFLCNGIYLINGQLQSQSLTALKNTFTKVINQSKWCEFDGKIYDFTTSTTSSDF